MVPARSGPPQQAIDWHGRRKAAAAAAQAKGPRYGPAWHVADHLRRGAQSMRSGSGNALIVGRRAGQSALAPV